MIALLLGLFVALSSDQSPPLPTSVLLIPLDAKDDEATQGFKTAFPLTTREAGVLFDLNGDGRLEQFAWTTPDTATAFLAIDRNGNGTIDSGQELFGDATLPNVGNGFAALRLMGQHNNVGGINAEDELYAKLLLWTDRNHNGYSEAGELQAFGLVRGHRSGVSLCA